MEFEVYGRIIILKILTMQTLPEARTFQFEFNVIPTYRVVNRGSCRRASPRQPQYYTATARRCSDLAVSAMTNCSRPRNVILAVTIPNTRATI